MTRTPEPARPCQGRRAVGSRSPPTKMRNGAMLREPVCWFLMQFNTLLPCDPAIALLSIYPNESKTYVDTKTCTQMVLAALIAKSWKQRRCPSVGDGLILSSAKEKWAIRPRKDLEET